MVNLEELYNFLNKYSFFQKRKEFEIHNIQNYGRKSKFLVIYKNENYIVLIDEERIQNYLNRLQLLGRPFKEIIELKYISSDKKVMVFNYYGGLAGKDLSYLYRNLIDLPDNLAERMFRLLENIHSYKISYINVDKKEETKTWFDFIYYKITKSLIKTYEYKGIRKKDIINIQKIIKKNKTYFDEVETCFIHADVTSVNVCYNPILDKLYLIDFDDFMVGDPLYDYSRMFNFSKEIPIFKKIQESYYPNIENNIIHLLYTLRVTLNWYWFVLERKLEYELPSKEIKELLNKIYKLSK